jgi:hypothetical protein
MSRRWVRAFGAGLGAGLTLVMLAGCALPPRPITPPPTSIAAPTSAAAPARLLPTRPHEVRLNGIDPCTLITPQLRSELYDLNDHFSHRKALDPLTSSDCTISNVPDDPGYVLSLRLVTAQGADFYLSSPKTAVTSVDGFGALDQPGLLDPSGNQSCLVIVDVARGQSLWVGFISNDGIPPGGYQAMCSKAHIAADSVMQQLLARVS